MTQQGFLSHGILAAIKRRNGCDRGQDLRGYMAAGLAGTVEAEGTQCIVPGTGSAAGDTA